MKNSEILLDAVGDISEELIPELSEKKKNHKILRTAFVSVGVCAAVVACAVFLPKIIIKENLHNTQTFEWEKKTGSENINPKISTGGTMGFEGMMAYDISELENGNPWTENTEITELPVFRNLSYTGDAYDGFVVYLTEEQMKNIAKKTAESINTEITEITVNRVKDSTDRIYPNEIMNGVYSLEAKCSSDVYCIFVEGDGTVGIWYNDEGIKLPDKYSFTYENTTEPQAKTTLDYLSKKYNSLLGYDNPVSFTFADRTYGGTATRSFYVYNGTGDITQDILNYSLSYAEFAPNDDGCLGVIWIYNHYSSCEYIGDYPIISKDDAQKLLLDGHYYSSVSNDYLKEDKISENDIAKVELIYSHNGEEYCQPYYKFYVELNNADFNMAENLRNFGVFYVPAVDRKYLSDNN